MPTANKILGQSKPAGATPTTVYTAAAQANCNVFIANTAATADAFRLAITKSGQALNIKDYLAYDMSITANCSLNFTGIALATGDFITVYSTSGNVSFNVTGIEIS
jgi:hypothetical protein